MQHQKTHLPFEPHSVRLARVADAPESPLAEKIAEELQERLLLHVDQSDFAQAFIERIRAYGFAVVRSSLFKPGQFQKAYDLFHQVFSKGEAYLSELGSPGPNKQDGYVQAGREFFVGADGERHKGNAFQFIHHTVFGNNAVLDDPLYREFDATVRDLKTRLFELYGQVNRAQAAGLRALGFTAPGGVPLDDEYFVRLIHGDSLRRNTSLIRVTHCIGSDAEEGEFCTKAHTDLNSDTLLPVASERGLQVWYSDKETPSNSGWVALRAPEDSVIVNMGQQKAIVTREFLPATEHRVITIPNQERMSYIFFGHFHADVELDKVRLEHPDYQDFSPYEMEAKLRMPKLPLTAANYTELIKMDIGLIEPEVGRELGFVPSCDLWWGE